MCVQFFTTVNFNESVIRLPFAVLVCDIAWPPRMQLQCVIDTNIIDYCDAGASDYVYGA